MIFERNIIRHFVIFEFLFRGDKPSFNWCVGIAQLRANEGNPQKCGMPIKSHREEMTVGKLDTNTTYFHSGRRCNTRCEN